MNLGASQSAVRRKLGSARPPAGEWQMTLARAWRLALVHGFSEAAGLVLTLETHTATSVDPPDMPALMGHGDLAILLEGVNGFGVALLDVQLMAALLESQTMGRALMRPATARVPTPTDGAMVADPLDRALVLFETHGKGVAGADTCFGMRFATPLADGRAVMLALPDAPHVLTDLVLSFGGGDRRGRLRLLLPAALPKPEGTGADPLWHSGMERNLMGARVQISAVLTRLHLPIAQISIFTVGTLLPVSPTALGQIALVGCTGALVAQGRLGQSHGRKAVMLEQFAGPVAALSPPRDSVTPPVGGLLTGVSPFQRR